MKLSNLKIGARLGLGFCIVLGMMTVIYVAAKVVNNRYQGQMRAQLEVAGERIQGLYVARGLLYEVGLAVRNIGLNSDVSLMQKEQATANQMRKEFIAQLQKLDTPDQSSEEQQAVKDLRQLDRDMEQPLQQASGLALGFDNEKSAQIITGTLEVLHRQSLQKINMLVAHEQGEGKEIAAADSARLQIVDALLMSLGGGALVLGAVIAWYVTRSITVPLRQAVALAEAVAQGDLTQTATYQGRDEVGHLIEAMRGMTGRLTAVIGDIRSATGSIDTAAREINVGNTDLSQRTEETASNLQETAASIEQLTGTVNHTAASARSASALAAEASAHAGQGGAVIEHVVTTMEEIDGASKRIADIIGVIDGIAFQTNILALNAAVEAARAGEQGRGFAVVASEVRSLAQRSAQAAREIKGLIGASTEKVESGSRLVQQAGEAMRHIVGDVQRLNTLISEISSGADEQSSGISQVNQAVGQVDQMTQQNAALVEQSAAAAEQLKGQASRLISMVGTFRLVGA